MMPRQLCVEVDELRFRLDQFEIILDKYKMFRMDGDGTFRRLNAHEIVVDQYIKHANDLDTFINFQDNNFQIDVGGKTALFLDDVDTNILLGADAGAVVDSGGDNILIGYQAGLVLAAGVENILIGTDAGKTLTNGDSNIVIGFNAMVACGTGAFGNIAIGYLALENLGTSGLETGNVAIGHVAMEDMDAGSGNVAIGASAMEHFTSGDSNVAIGQETLKSTTVGSGDENVAIGELAMTAATSASNNVVIGYRAGLALTTGTLNVFLGNLAGSQETTGANKLFIDNTNTATPLIYGEFDNDILRFTAGVTIVGTLDVIHTAAEADDHAVELDVNAAGYGDVKALDIDYITGAISAGEDEAIILINIDEIAAGGGDVFGIEVLATDGGAGVYGMKVGALIGPIHQDSGTFANPTTGTNNTPSTDVPAMIDGNVGTTTPIFQAQNEYIIIGAAGAFEEIEFILTTPSSLPGIKPTFWYSTVGTGQFTQFTPVDGTNGFRNTGVIAWDASDLTGHVADDVTLTFDIKIIRTRNTLGTEPTLGYAKTAATTEYIWDKSGNLTIATLRTTKLAADTLLLQIYDVDGAAYTTFATLTANNTPTWVFNQDISFSGDILLADGSVVGITGNEVITFNAAGTIVLTGADFGVGKVPSRRLHVDYDSGGALSQVAFFEGGSTDGDESEIEVGASLANWVVSIMGHHYDDSAGDNYGYLRLYGQAKSLTWNATGVTIPGGLNVGTATGATPGDVFGSGELVMSGTGLSSFAGRVFVKANAEAFSMGVSRSEANSETYWLGVAAGGANADFQFSDKDGNSLVVITKVGCLTDSTCEIFTEDALSIIKDIHAHGSGERDEYGHEHFDMSWIFSKYPFLIHKSGNSYFDKLGAKSDLLYRAVLQLDERLVQMEKLLHV